MCVCCQICCQCRSTGHCCSSYVLTSLWKWFKTQPGVNGLSNIFIFFVVFVCFLEFVHRFYLIVRL